MVSEGSPVHRQLLCKYVGRNRHNQGLIGNRGVRRFARSHVLKSGETIGKLLAAGHLPSCANKRADYLARRSFEGLKEKRARDYVVGHRFRMRLADARHLWPGWQGNTRDNNRVCWAVIPNDRRIRRDWWAFSDHTYYDPETDPRDWRSRLARSRLANEDLVCKYVGRNRHNRDLIGNHGARRFALSHVLRSGETIQDLLDAGHPPKTTTSQKPTRKRKRDFTTLDFTKEVFNPRNTPLPRFEGSYVRPLHVDVIIVSKHLAIMIPAGHQDGKWIANLDIGIALAHSVGMVGFKLDQHPAGTCNIRFGYYNFFEDAEEAMRVLLDHTSDKVIPDGIKVGKRAPRANPPRVRRKRVLYPT